MRRRIDDEIGIVLPAPGQALVITPDRFEVHKLAGKYAELEELQRWVGGYIEAVHLDAPAARYVLFLDEEGKLKGRPLNPIATAIMIHYSGVAADDFAAGTAVIVPIENLDTGADDV